MHCKIVVVWTQNKEKISFKNDNLVVTDQDDQVKLQLSCYKLFTIFIVGGLTITTGLIERAKRFGFSIVLFTSGFKVYETMNYCTEGNTLLRAKQYNTTNSLYISRQIILNKTGNQIQILKRLRIKDLDAIDMIKNCQNEIKAANDLQTIMGYEGIAAKAYFNRVFGEQDWKGRRPRIKRDPINLLLDIGYTVLFNYIDALCNLYGFDNYKGNLHQQFFKRKSLVCDLVEPFRPIVDYATRKMLNLKQVTDQDWSVSRDGRYSLAWKESAKVVGIYVHEISNHKQSLFRYVQGYYRWFMRNALEIKNEMPQGEIKENDFDKL